MATNIPAGDAGGNIYYVFFSQGIAAGNYCTN
jgi:hypothetical protein